MIYGFLKRINLQLWKEFEIIKIINLFAPSLHHTASPAPKPHTELSKMKTKSFNINFQQLLSGNDADADDVVVTFAVDDDVNVDVNVVVAADDGDDDDAATDDDAT